MMLLTYQEGVDNFWYAYDSGYKGVQLTPPIEAGVWNMMTYTINSTDLVAYVNGSYLGQIALSGYDFVDANIWIFGKKITSSEYLGNLKIDEWGIWNRSLSASEISQLYNSGNGLSYSSGNYADSGIKNTTLYVYNNSSGALINNTTKISTDLTSIFNAIVGIPMVLSSCIFSWFADVFDFAGNYNNTTNQTLLIDTIYPQINYTITL
jgi:hypothetical protein